MALDKDKFLSWEASSRDTIDVKRCYMRLAGDPVAGILLSQIIYLFLPDRNGYDKSQLVERDGYLWVAIKRADWDEECCLTPKRYDSACEALEKKGLIISHVYRLAGETIKHLRINWDVFLESLEAHEKGHRERIRSNRGRKSPAPPVPPPPIPQKTEPEENVSATEPEATTKPPVSSQGVNRELPEKEFRNYPKRDSRFPDKGIPLHTVETPDSETQYETPILTFNVGNGINFVDKEAGGEPENQPASTTSTLDILVAKIVSELRDYGSERRHRQLITICWDNGVPGLVDTALRLTGERLADEKRLGVLEKPARYYDATLTRLLAEQGIHVPRKAEQRETMDEMRDMLGLPADASPEQIREALRLSMAGPPAEAVDTS